MMNLEALVLLVGIYSAVIMHDIFEIDKREDERKITDPDF